MAVVIHINANLAWRAERGARSSRWIGFCDALGISAEADSLDELHDAIPEAIDLLMTDLVEDNELDEFLEDRGWTTSRSEVVQEGDGGVSVPWFLVTEGGYGPSRAAY